MMDYLIGEAEAWVVHEHNHLWDTGKPLAQNDIIPLEKFFNSNTLDQVRIVYVDQIENPPFIKGLLDKGITLSLNFNQVTAITFINTVVIASPKLKQEIWLPLLFHECVHVVQYQLLGTRRFMELYIYGWLSQGMDYYKIPLEVDAANLHKRFEAHPDNFFSAEREVMEQLKNHTYA